MVVSDLEGQRRLLVHVVGLQVVLDQGEYMRIGGEGGSISGSRRVLIRHPVMAPRSRSRSTTWTGTSTVGGSWRPPRGPSGGTGVGRPACLVPRRRRAPPVRVHL